MQDIKKEVFRINEYLKQYEWMDFSYEIINNIEIKIIGSMDLSWENYHSIELFFDNPINISTVLFDWHKHESLPFIELSSREEVVDKLGEVANEEYIFKINVDGYEKSPICIVAKSIRCNILK